MESRLRQLINRKFLTMDNIKEVEQFPEVEITEDCGMSGKYSLFHYEVVYIREGEELVEYELYYR